MPLGRGSLSRVFLAIVLGLAVLGPPPVAGQSAPAGPDALRLSLERLAQDFRATALFAPDGVFARIYAPPGSTALSRMAALAPLTDRATWRPFFAAMMPVVACANLATPVILFVSPFHDVALWTEWNLRTATLRSAVAFPGDLLLTNRPVTIEPTPGWMRMPSASKGDVFDAAYRSFILEMAGFRQRAPLGGCRQAVSAPPGVDDATPRGIARARLRMTAGIDAALARAPLARLRAPIASFFISGNVAAFTASFGTPPPADAITFVRNRRAAAASLTQGQPLLPVFAAAGTGATARGFIVYVDALDPARHVLVSGGAAASQPLSLSTFNFVP